MFTKLYYRKEGSRVFEIGMCFGRLMKVEELGFLNGEYQKT